MKDALVIGAGPAGLMAADMLSRSGQRVILAEAMPSPARKLLMAGKSGLNLTKQEEFKTFLAAYGEAADYLRPMITDFGPDQVQQWAQALNQPLFTGSTGRVFPKAMKASPLLRAWLAQLAQQGVHLRRRWRWIGWNSEGFQFDTPEGVQTLTPSVAVLACGGASWARLGSDGAWTTYMSATDISPFKPANMGFAVDWTTHMQRHFGTPVKGVALTAGHSHSRGEFVITKQGVEGGGIYVVSQALREGAPLFVDLAPDLNETELRRRLSRPRGKQSRANHLRKTLKLDPVKQALLMECVHPLPEDIAPLIKALPLHLQGSAPMDRAISTAGGLCFSALDETLMLRNHPGVFAAGEMLNWEAPTGGYLLTACLATGRWAGQAAAAFCNLPASFW